MSRTPARCTIGSVPALLVMLSPAPPGRPTARCTSRRRLRQPGIADREQRRDNQPPPALSPAIAIRAGFTPRAKQEPVAGESVLDRRRERVLGGEPVGERQRRRVRRSAGLGDQMAVAVERADDIAAAMEVEQRRVAVDAPASRSIRRARRGGHRLDRDSPAAARYWRLRSSRSRRRCR